MGGGGSRTSQSAAPATTTQKTEFPPEVQELFKFITPELQKTLEALPLSSFLTERPQQIPGLTPDQQREADYFQGRAQGPLTYGFESDALARLQGMAGAQTVLREEPEALAYAQMQAVLNAPIGESAELQASREALNRRFAEDVLPALQNEAALAGLGNSGAYVESLRRAQGDVNDALIPLLAQETARRDAAVGNLLALGQTEGGRRFAGEQQRLASLQALLGTGQALDLRETARHQQAFDMGEATRQLAAEQEQANLADYLRRQDIITGITGSVTGTLLPASLTNVTQTSALKAGSKTSGPGMLYGGLTGSAK